MKLSLVVIRCKNIEESRDFYEKLGLNFNLEKHGKGPTHYSCQIGGTVLELYPNKDEAPQDNTRLGFRVSSAENVVSQMPVIDIYEFAGKSVYVVADPDGRKVEIS